MGPRQALCDLVGLMVAHALCNLLYDASFKKRKYSAPALLLTRDGRLGPARPQVGQGLLYYLATTRCQPPLTPARFRSLAGRIDGGVGQSRTRSGRYG